LNVADIPLPNAARTQSPCAHLQPRHCEEYSDVAISQPRHCEEHSDAAISPPRHCEERSDVAIHAAVPSPGTSKPTGKQSGLPRAFGPRNDGVGEFAAGANDGWRSALFGRVAPAAGRRLGMWIMTRFAAQRVYAVIREGACSGCSLISAMISGWRMSRD
jgi:hypothetical protein